MNIFERQTIDYINYKYVAGVDEAGRGPLAGPLVVAAVILKDHVYNKNLNDSKKVSTKQRDLLYDWVIENTVSYSINIISPQVIDDMNILQATLYGMKLCILDLQIKPDLVLIDGNIIPKGIEAQCKPIIKGDSIYACIAAASILAKVTRDRILFDLDKLYPLYEFSKHKGYPTKKHIDIIKRYGITPEHRLTYTPCKVIIN